jgi:outer membrane protein assembly factor BamE
MLSFSYSFLRHFKQFTKVAFVCVVLSSCASNNTPTNNGTVISNNKEESSVRTIKKEGFLDWLSPYRPDIQQGNFISKEMMANIQIGFSKEQVKFILGTPLLTDIFHANRWDYPFSLEKSNGEVTTNIVSIFFDENEKVSRFEGGNLPSEKDYLNRIATPVTPNK